MTNSFANMNEEYVRKHFPNGSVFDGAVKTVKRTTIIAIFCFSVPITIKYHWWLKPKALTCLISLTRQTV